MKIHFQVIQTRSSYEIRHGRQTIARGDRDYGFQILRDLVVRPGQRPLISFHQLTPTCFGRVNTTPGVRCSPDRAEICLVTGGLGGKMDHCGRATVKLAPDGRSFLWDFVHQSRVVKTMPSPERFFPRTDVDREYADRGVWVFEVTDPMPHGPFGPKDGPVPVDRPDIRFPQAWFRKGGWKKNWTHFLFARKDGKLIRIPMNHLENHDKDFWRQSPNGFIAFLGGKGTNLRYRLLEGTGRRICHHYCMWGYDIHFFEILGAGSGGHPNPRPVLKPGRRFYHHYVLEALTDAESARMLRKSEEHPLREGDLERLKHAPLYNPGPNLFQKALGRQDDRGFFQPATVAQFLPRHPGRRSPGCILIDNHQGAFDLKGKGVSLYNAWSIGLGSDNWHAPIASNARYEISAWVKMEGEPGTVARIGMRYCVQKNQAKPNWKVSWSRDSFSNEIRGKTGWVRLVLRTARLPRDYVCAMSIRLELIGRGIAYFDEFELKRVA